MVCNKVARRLLDGRNPTMGGLDSIQMDLLWVTMGLGLQAVEVSLEMKRASGLADMQENMSYNQLYSWAVEP